MRTPKLKKINLNKRFRGDEGSGNCDHPDIKTGISYLVQYDGSLYAGTFTRQWYGWNFDGIYDAGAQLDYSGWEAIWQIMR